MPWLFPQVLSTVVYQELPWQKFFYYGGGLEILVIKMSTNLNLKQPSTLQIGQSTPLLFTKYLSRLACPADFSG